MSREPAPASHWHGAPAAATRGVSSKQYVAYTAAAIATHWQVLSSGNNGAMQGGPKGPCFANAGASVHVCLFVSFKNAWNANYNINWYSAGIPHDTPAEYQLPKPPGTLREPLMRAIYVNLKSEAAAKKNAPVNHRQFRVTYTGAGFYHTGLRACLRGSTPMLCNPTRKH